MNGPRQPKPRPSRKHQPAPALSDYPVAWSGSHVKRAKLCTAGTASAHHHRCRTPHRQGTSALGPRNL